MTLHAIAMHFTQKIRWLISKNDTIVHDLLSLAGWSIINPLVYQKLYPIFPNEELYKELNFNELFVFNDHTLVETDTLIFISSIHLESDNSFSSDFTNFLTSFTACLRFVSKQAELLGVSYRSYLDLHLNAEEEQNLRTLLILDFPRLRDLGKVHWKKYLLDTAVRWHSLKIADEFLLTDELPMYGTLLLDAIHAVQQNDYRRAILYAAISVESLAASKLDEIYSSFLTNGDPTNMLRIIIVQTREGKKKIDPIYESLRAKSRNDFSQLLHERPLYLERRSLLIENEPLYQQAMKLHSTRNKIAHSGGLPLEQKDSFFKLDKYGAFFAITCAKNVFQWFGITEEYYLPLDNMVSIDEYYP